MADKHSKIFEYLKPVLEQHKDKPFFKALVCYVIPKHGDINLLDLAWIGCNWDTIPVLLWYQVDEIKLKK